jgi:phenylacetate-CoA ligase
MSHKLDYATLKGKHYAEMQALMPEFVARTHWPAERIRAERENGLRRLLRAAIDGSPWYHKTLGDIDPETFDSGNLTSLPVLTKAEFTANFDEIVTDRRVTAAVVEDYLAGLGEQDAYLFDAYHATVSGGSSGVRALLAFDWDSWTKYYLALFRYIYRDPRFSRGKNGKAPRVVGLASNTSAYLSSSLRQTFRQPGQESIGLSILDPMSTNVDRLNEINPEVLFAYPSVLRPLVAQARHGTLRVGPMAIISVGEPLMADLADEIRAIWPEIIIYDWYMAGEGGCIAAGCGIGAGLHLSEDLVILEPVDVDYRPVPPGVRSDKVLITNLANPLMPLIRYELEDQVTLLPPGEPCPCGSQHQRIATVDGRYWENFHYPGGIEVASLKLYSPLNRESSVSEFQMRQLPNGAAVELRGDNPDLPRIVRKLKAALTDAGLTDPEVTVKEVEWLPRLEISGKRTRFVPLPRENAG